MQTSDRSTRSNPANVNAQQVNDSSEPVRETPKVGEKSSANDSESTKEEESDQGHDKSDGNDSSGGESSCTDSSGTESSTDKSSATSTENEDSGMEAQSDLVAKSQIFSGENYLSWKKLIRVNLRAKGWMDVLTPYEEPTKASDKAKARKTRDRHEGKAFAFIYNRLDPIRQAAVNSVETPIELFKILDATYERKGPVNVIAIQTKIGAMQYDLKNPLEEHLADFERLCSMMVNTNEKELLPFTLKIAWLLKTLPDRWAHVKTVINALSGEKRNMEYIRSLLLTEETMLKDSHEYKEESRKSAFHARSQQDRRDQDRGNRENRYWNPKSERSNRRNPKSSIRDHSHDRGGDRWLDDESSCGSDNDARSTCSTRSTRSRNMKCFRCNTYGHIGRECPKYGDHRRAPERRQSRNYDGEHPRRYAHEAEVIQKQEQQMDTPVGAKRTASTNLAEAHFRHAPTQTTNRSWRNPLNR